MPLTPENIVPNTFADESGTQPASQLDDNFTATLEYAKDGVSVLLYGADDSGDTTKAASNVTAIAAAIAAAIASGINRVIFPVWTKGQYCITGDSGWLIDVSDATDLVLEGYGATLIVTWDPTDPENILPVIRFVDCASPVVRGLSIDHSPRIFSQGVITAVSTYYIDITIEAGYEPAFATTDFCVGYSVDKSQVIGWNFPTYGPFTFGAQGGGVWRINFQTGAVAFQPITLDGSGGSNPFWHGSAIPAVGQSVAVVVRKRDGMSLTFRRATDAVVEDFRVFSSSFGLMSGVDFAGPTFRNVTLQGHPGDLYSSGTGINCHSVRGTFTMQDCSSDCIGDDYLNVNTRTWVTTAQGANTVTALFAVQDSGVDIPPPRVGDIIEFWPPDPTIRYQLTCTAATGTPHTSPTAWVITLSDVVPAGFDYTTWYVFNRSLVPALRLDRITTSRGCGHSVLPYSDDAVITDHKVFGHYGAPIGIEWPIGLAGFAGGLDLYNFHYKGCSQQQTSHSAGVPIWLVLAANVDVETTGASAMSNANLTVIRNGLLEDSGFGGITIGGVDATINGVVLKNIGGLRAGGPSSEPYNNDLWIGASTVTKGSFIDLDDGPVYVDPNTGTLVDVVPTPAATLKNIYTPETIDYLQSFTQVLFGSAARTRAALLDDLIGALVTSGTWAKIRGFWLFGNVSSEAALINVWNPIGTRATAVASPTFTVDRGYTGNGSSSYVNSGVPWNTVGRDSFSAWVWSLTNSANNNFIDLGTLTGSAVRLNPRNSGNQFSTRANDATATTTASADSRGFFGFSRSLSTQYSQYINNGAPTVITTNSTNTPTSPNFTFLTGNTLFSSRQLMAGGVGLGMTDADMLALYNALLAYKTGIGA